MEKEPEILRVEEDELSTDVLFLTTIEKLRGQWFPLMLTIGFNQDFMRRQFPQCASDFVPIATDTLFHEMFRCGNTAYFLWHLFGGRRPTPLLRGRTDTHVRNENNKRLLGKLKDYVREEITLYLITLGGHLPEHVMVLVQINQTYYIMQSFVNTYTFSSPHGFIEVGDIDHFLWMLSVFQGLADMRYSEETMDLEGQQREEYEEAMRRFAFYTHIDVDKYMDKTEALRTETDFARMQVMKTFVMADFVAEQMRDIIKHMCTGIEQSFSSRATTNLLPDQSYNIFLRNWLLEPDLYKVVDLADAKVLNDKLIHYAGFNGHTYKLDMINLRYHDQIQMTMEPDDDTVIDVMVIKFKVSVNLSNLVWQGMAKVFGCNFIGS
jgi:hypothetical protein